MLQNALNKVQFSLNLASGFKLVKLKHYNVLILMHLALRLHHNTRPTTAITSSSTCNNVHAIDVVYTKQEVIDFRK